MKTFILISLIGGALAKGCARGAGEAAQSGAKSSDEIIQGGSKSADDAFQNGVTKGSARSARYLENDTNSRH
jgi:hypothetical protein